MPGLIRPGTPRHRPVLDQTVALLVGGYRCLPALRRRSADDIVTTRLAGRRAVVAAGPEAVRTFYDTERFERSGAIPAPVLNTLFGRGAVHGLDGAAHRRRKQLFLDVLAADRVCDLADRVDAEWAEAVQAWQVRDRVTVFDEAVRVLGAGVLGWAGVPTRPDQAAARSRELMLVVDGFGSAGPRHLRARLARRRCESWARRAVLDVRAGRVDAAPGTALAAVAAHRDDDGSPLDARTAAVELLNVLRPTVAVAWLVTFAVLALVERPEWRARLTDGSEAERLAFVHEVRRVYPFVPALAARARYDLEFQGRRLPAGSLFVLDVHGTDTDPRVWTRPHALDPDRFLTGAPPEPDALVPQGGGDARTGHRCPGEVAAIELTGRAARLFAGLDYGVPPQDLRLPRRRMPTRPRSGMVVVHVRRR